MLSYILKQSGQKCIGRSAADGSQELKVIMGENKMKKLFTELFRRHYERDHEWLKSKILSIGTVLVAFSVVSNVRRLKMLNKNTCTTANMMSAVAVLIAAAAVLLSAGVAQAQPMFGGWANIGQPGNDNDTGGTGHGGVDYEYQIGKHAVSDNDYEDVMNNSSGYSSPKNYINVYDAMEFANALTEEEHGHSNYNVYDLSDSGYSINYGRSQAISDGNRVYALPTEDEWYKAAYYSLEKSTLPGGEAYYDFAHGKNTEPPKGDGDEEFRYSDWDQPRDASVGGLEQNDTRNMMGNVFEWVEDDSGVVRGGNYSYGVDYLNSSTRGTFYDDTQELKRVGFRVVAVPEPGSAMLFALAGGLLWCVSRRKARA